MTGITGRSFLTPQRVIVLGFAAVIAIGGFLLTLPIASRQGNVNWLDAFFTATSAVCVTGLVVVDTADTYTVFGRTVILILIQVGGLGVATISTMTALLIGRRLGLRDRILLQEALNRSDLQGMVRLLRYVVGITLTIEAAGALLLTLFWLPAAGPWRALGWGVFHSVSAFNNAGFDVLGNYRSLIGQPAPITTVIAVLIILGGLGFVVLSDLQKGLRWSLWSYHTRLVVLATAALIVLGTVLLALVEASGGGDWVLLPWWEQLRHAAFQSITARTAGYASVNIGQLHHGSLLVLMFLMFVGASPNSTGGGIKTTTFAALLTAVRATLTRRPDPIALARRIGPESVQRSVALAFLSVLLVVAATGLLSVFEPAIPFSSVLFEVVSAFGTVGLSTGITPQLSLAGKVILMATMFLGRAGLLTFVVAIARQQAEPFRYPEAKILVG